MWQGVSRVVTCQRENLICVFWQQVAVFLVLCSILVSQSAPGSNLGESEKKDKQIHIIFYKESFFLLFYNSDSRVIPQLGV